jgi:hypothetical protein
MATRLQASNQLAHATSVYIAGLATEIAAQRRPRAPAIASLGRA